MRESTQRKDKIIIFGAGLSATSLIQYLLENSTEFGWKVTVVDRNMDLLQSKTKDHPNAIPLVLDITDAAALREVMCSQDVAISLLPPEMHALIAEACIEEATHLFTASYITDSIAVLEPRIKSTGLVFMSELGADPGIDHLSMVKMITELHQIQSQILEIKSMTGALVRPEDLMDNPLKYKFTWNPDNVIRAGENGGAYIKDHKTHRVEYSNLYAEVFPVRVDGMEDLYCYYNRSAADYIQKYEIPEVPDFLRGTLRYREFMKTWHVLVQTGLTVERTEADTNNHSTGELIRQYLGTDLAVADYLRATYPDLVDDVVYDTLVWLRLDSEEILGMGPKPYYQVLKNHLLPILKLLPEDHDLLVMKHEISCMKEDQKMLHEATLKVYGKNSNSTAISDTVGLPLAIFTKLFMTDQVSLEPGLHIPNIYALSNPILDELEEYDIKFVYKESLV